MKVVNTAKNNNDFSILENGSSKWTMKAATNIVTAGKKLNIEEMNSIISLMEKTPKASQWNHGRPTFVELRLKDVEALFGRT